MYIAVMTMASPRDIGDGHGLTAQCDGKPHCKDLFQGHHIRGASCRRMRLRPRLRPDSHGTDHQGHAEHRRPRACVVWEVDAAGGCGHQGDNGDYCHLDDGEAACAFGRGVSPETDDVQRVEGGRYQGYSLTETRPETVLATRSRAQPWP